MDDEYDVNLTITLVLEENGFKVDSFNDPSQAENFTSGLYVLDDKVIICYLTAVDEVSSEDLSVILTSMKFVSYISQ